MSDYTLKPSSTYNGWSNKETWLVQLWLGDVLDADKEEGATITPDHICVWASAKLAVLRAGQRRILCYTD